MGVLSLLQHQFGIAEFCKIGGFGLLAIAKEYESRRSCGTSPPVPSRFFPEIDKSKDMVLFGALKAQISFLPEIYAMK